MKRRLLEVAVLPPTLILGGMLGYHFVEGWTLFDSLYMAIITLTTIGFGEVHPLTTAGRVFTMVLSLMGIFTLFFAATEIVRTWASGELRTIMGLQRLEKSMAKLEDHVIVCGYGRMGRLVCQELARAAVPFVIIDQNGASLADFALAGGVPLHDDASTDECLRRAGIARARALVTVVSSDADNLFITMSARLLNERVQIIARAEEEATANKLVRAGASRVISPYVIGGSRVTQAILRPTVLDFIEVASLRSHMELQLEEVTIDPNSDLVGRAIGATKIRDRFNVIIVAKKGSEATMMFNPPDHALLAAGDTLVMLGARVQLDRVEELAKARRP